MASPTGPFIPDPGKHLEDAGKKPFRYSRWEFLLTARYNLRRHWRQYAALAISWLAGQVGRAWLWILPALRETSIFVIATCVDAKDVITRQQPLRRSGTKRVQGAARFLSLLALILSVVALRILFR